MKLIYGFAGLCLLLGACATNTEQTAETTETKDTSSELFEKNSATVAAYLEDWQNENVDYAKYFADDYRSWSTGIGDVDTTYLEETIESTKNTWKYNDFEIVTDPLNLLPGVNVDTKKPDGSVRYYGQWRITRTATDSTEERSTTIQLYQAYVFNEEGKINLTLTYADFGALGNYMQGDE